MKRLQYSKGSEKGTAYLSFLQLSDGRWVDAIAMIFRPEMAEFVDSREELEEIMAEEGYVLEYEEEVEYDEEGRLVHG